MAEEDDVGVDPDDPPQPEPVDAGVQGVVGLGVGQVVGGVVLPHGGHIRPHPHRVEQPDGGHDERPGAQEEGLLPGGVAHEPQPGAVGLLPVDLAVPVAGDGGGVDEVELEVAEAPPVDDLGDELAHVGLGGGVGRVQRVVVAAPVGAGHGQSAVGVVDEHLRVVAHGPRAGQGDEGRHPQARLHAGLPDPTRGGLHPVAEALAGLPVADRDLPAVVDLKRLEAQLGDLRDLALEGLLRDALVVGVPGAPHALRLDRPGPQALAELARVAGHDGGGRAGQDHPARRVAGLGEGLQDRGVGAQPRRAPVQAAHEQRPGGVLQDRHPGRVVAGRVVPGGVVGGPTALLVGDAHGRLAQAAPARRRPGVLAGAVELAVAHVVQEGQVGGLDVDRAGGAAGTVLGGHRAIAGQGDAPPGQGDVVNHALSSAPACPARGSGPPRGTGTARLALYVLPTVQTDIFFKDDAEPRRL